MMYRIASLLLLSLLCAALPETTVADEPDNADAKVYFTEGERLFDAGSYLEAAAAFQRAYEASPHPAVLINIGYCYEYAKAYVKAVTVYKEYLSTDFEKDPATVEDIKKRLAVLELMVGELHINCLPNDCKVEVDGVLKGQTEGGSLVVVMDPGKYSVAVSGDRVQSDTGTYRVEAGEKTYARFTLKPKKVESSPTPGTEGPPKTTGASATRNTTQNRSARNLKPAFIVLTGSAIAGGVLVAVFGSLTLSAKSDYEASEYRDASARDATLRNKLITNVSIGAASALAVGALAVKLVDLRSAENSKNLALSLGVESGTTLAIRGRF